MSEQEEKQQAINVSTENMALIRDLQTLMAVYYTPYKLTLEKELIINRALADLKETLCKTV